MTKSIVLPASLKEMNDDTWVLGSSSQFLHYTGADFTRSRAYLIHSTGGGSAAPMRMFMEGTTDITPVLQ